MRRKLIRLPAVVRPRAPAEVIILFLVGALGPITFTHTQETPRGFWLQIDMRFERHWR